MKIIPDKTKLFPKSVVDAYAEMVEAREAYSIACREYAPEPPLKKGDKIQVKNINSGKFENCIVSTDPSYDPYSSHDMFEGFSIIVTVYNKTFTNKLKRRHSINLVSNGWKDDEIILIERFK